MSQFPFLPKEHPGLPDSYMVTVKYHDGREEQFELVNHVFMFTGGYIELCTVQGEFIVIPATAYRTIRFDSRWSKIVEIKKEIEAKRLAEAQQQQRLEAINGVPS